MSEIAKATRATTTMVATPCRTTSRDVRYPLRKYTAMAMATASAVAAPATIGASMPSRWSRAAGQAVAKAPSVPRKPVMKPVKPEKASAITAPERRFRSFGREPVEDWSRRPERRFSAGLRPAASLSLAAIAVIAGSVIRQRGFRENCDVGSDGLASRLRPGRTDVRAAVHDGGGADPGAEIPRGQDQGHRAWT